VIPDQLESNQPVFLKIASQSKAPEKGNSASDGPFFHASDSRLVRHLGQNGNVARVLRDDLVAFDIDSPNFLELVDKELGSSFTIESGGNGFGLHRYYRCSGWDGNHNQITVDGDDYGSLRTGNSYCLIPPSVHDETGKQYQVETDISVTSVSPSRIQSLLETVGKAANTAGRRPPAGVGCSLPEIPENYPNQEAEWEVLKSWLDSNGLLYKLNKKASEDWSGLEFTLAKCLAEGGFSESSISTALDRLPQFSKWHRREEAYQQRTVRKAVLAACDDDYVDFSQNDDMGASKASKSRKTESGDGNRTNGGENDMNYNTKENLTVYNADSVEEAKDGDRVVRVELTNMAGTGDDGEPVDTDFITITKGTLRENGDFGVAPEFPGQSKSVGAASPEDLRLIAEGLETMAEELE